MTNRRTLPQDAIDDIKAAGYRVYMRDRADSHCIYGNELGLGQVQFDPVSGFSICTKHKPNRKSGTGFQVSTWITRLTPELLFEGLATLPAWAKARGYEIPHKYRDIEEYRAEHPFNAEYAEI